MIYIASFIATSASLIVISICFPWLLSDKNTFLLNFVNHEMLGFLGITVPLTIASGYALFVELSKREEKVKKNFFDKSKNAIKKSCKLLIALIAVTVNLVSVKPVTPDNDIIRSLFNSAALMIVFANIAVMYDIVFMAFRTDKKFEQS